MGAFAYENLQKVHEIQQWNYKKGACLWIFQLGNKVLLLLPSSERKLKAQWQGPYEVVNCLIRQSGRKEEGTAGLSHKFAEPVEIRGRPYHHV